MKQWLENLIGEQSRGQDHDDKLRSNGAHKADAIDTSKG